MKIKTADFWEEVKKLTPNDAIVLPLRGGEAYESSMIHKIYLELMRKNRWLLKSINYYNYHSDRPISKAPLCFNVSETAPSILVVNYYLDHWHNYNTVRIYNPGLIEQHIKDRNIEKLICPKFTDHTKGLDKQWDNRYTLIRAK